MAQGKLKVKTKLPPSTKSKVGKKKNNLPIQRRGNAPVRPKKAKLEETHKLKQMITKRVNKSMEDELRQRVMEGKKSLTKKETPSVPQKK